MADGSHIQAQAVECKGRAMLREFLPLGATIESPAGFDLKSPMTPDGIVGVMNVAIEGEWMGHPSGPFSMDADKMLECCERFAQQENPMLVDYEHNSLGGVDGRAAGWIHALNIRAGDEGRTELWATVEWTARAAEMIRAGEYRYCSPVIDFGAKDRATGEHVPVELFNVAITNQPFLDGMHPIALSRVAAAVMPPEREDEPAANAAPPTEPEPDPEDENDGEEAAEGESEDGEGSTESAPETPPPPPAEPSGAEQLTAFLEAVMRASDGSKAAVIAALNELSDDVGGMVRTRLDTTDGSASDAQEIPMSDKPETQTTENKDEVLLALARELGALRTEMAEEKKARVEAKAKAEADAAAALSQANQARIDAMLTDGRLSEGEREPAQRLLNSNSTLFEEIYGKRIAGSASPVGRRQADSGNGQRVSASKDDDVAADLESLSATERAAYDAIVAQRKDPKATLRRLINSRNSAMPARRSAAATTE